MTHELRTPPPASAAWREGDAPGQRQFVDVGRVDLELGGELPNVRVAYETYGTLNADASNAVLVLHALTGDSHLAGPVGPGHPTPGWWEPLLAPGAPLDPAEWFVVAPNVLGGCQGTTGPASLAPDGRPWGSRFPRITVRDQVAVERLLTDALGIRRGQLSSAARWAACAPWSGPSTTPTACEPRSSWPWGQRPPPTRSAPRLHRSTPSPPTRSGAVVTTTRRPTAMGRTSAWVSLDALPTSRTAPSPSSTFGSDVNRKRVRIPWREDASPCRATSTITPTSSPTASTPARTSPSPTR